jgi:glucosamine-6-phosphate deaminase
MHYPLESMPKKWYSSFTEIVKFLTNSKGVFHLKIYKTTDYEGLSRKAASIIASQVILKPDCVLGLATGSSPLGTYKNLIELYEKGDLDFSAVHTANLDEYRGLTRENDQSYYYFMYNNLFKHINIPLENTNIPDGSQPDSDAECTRYDNVINDLGGIDLQLLGLGLNGHIGFNEPAADFAKTTHCVDLTPSTIEANKRFFASADEVPKQAYTMGIKTIMQARKILLIVNGKAKAHILHEALCGPITPQVPASILQLHPDVTVVADEEALSEF